ncbi:MAG: hypothetical protein WC464_01450 [Bdellovibrionales bacterium]
MSRDDLDQSVYDAVEYVVHSKQDGTREAFFRFGSDRKILHTGRTWAPVGQISFSSVTHENLYVVNNVFVAENHTGNYREPFLASAGKLSTLLTEAHHNKVINLGLEDKNTKLYIPLSAEGILDFRVYRFPVISRIGVDPYIELQKLGPIFEKAYILDSYQTCNYVARCQTPALMDAFNMGIAFRRPSKIPSMAASGATPP